MVQNSHFCFCFSWFSKVFMVRAWFFYVFLGFNNCSHGQELQRIEQKTARYSRPFMAGPWRGWCFAKLVCTWGDGTHPHIYIYVYICVCADIRFMAAACQETVSEARLLRAKREREPRQPNCLETDPKYHHVETIRPLLEVHWGSKYLM